MLRLTPLTYPVLIVTYLETTMSSSYPPPTRSADVWLILTPSAAALILAIVAGINGFSDLAIALLFCATVCLVALAANIGMIARVLAAITMLVSLWAASVLYVIAHWPI